MKQTVKKAFEDTYGEHSVFGCFWLGFFSFSNKMKCTCSQYINYES